MRHALAPTGKDPLGKMVIPGDRAKDERAFDGHGAESDRTRKGRGA